MDRVNTDMGRCHRCGCGAGEGVALRKRIIRQSMSPQRWTSLQYMFRRESGLPGPCGVAWCIKGAGHEDGLYERK